jgi:beta-N-acetylhexosaminidase
VDVTQTWKEEELYPYQQLLPLFSTCAMVMSAHVVHYGLDKEGHAASLSAAITNDLLRKKLNFHGVVITDDLQMKAITNKYSLAESLRLAINAGADLLVFGNQLVKTFQDPEELVQMIYADVMAGHIAESRIEEAYTRILKLKSILIS